MRIHQARARRREGLDFDVDQVARARFLRLAGGFEIDVIEFRIIFGQQDHLGVLGNLR